MSHRNIFPLAAVLISTLSLVIVDGAALHKCHSCFASCALTPDGELGEDCDCGGARHAATRNHTSPLGVRPLNKGKEEHSCYGESCYAKVEFFPDEMVGVLQKGCAHSPPAGLNGCYYAGQLESIQCHCEGELCNSKRALDFYKAKPLATVECCECSQPGGDNCPNSECLRTCKGNYCLVDFDGVEQGCGVGIPRLQSFLRTPGYLREDLPKSHTTCARYQATTNTNVHGCVCSEPMSVGQEGKLGCNQLNRSRHYQLEEVVQRRINDQHYCYSLHQRSDKPFDRSVFNLSDTCEGHYCFISQTTSEVVVELREWEGDNNASNHVGTARTRYELLAGCLKVDDDAKVGVGCTTEYASNEPGSLPTSRHCICDSHLCNFYPTLQFNTTVERLRALEVELEANPSDPSSKSSSVYRDDGDLEPTSGSSGLWKSAFSGLMLVLLATWLCGGE